jgi:hypothetical protein
MGIKISERRGVMKDRKRENSKIEYVMGQRYRGEN